MGDEVTQFIADGLVFLIVAIAAVALLFGVPNKQKFEVYSRMLVAGLTAYLIAKLLAAVWQPSTERPFETLGVDPGASYLNNPGFPSDHSLFVWVIVYAVWFAVPRKWLVLSLAVMALLVVAAVIGAVRLYFGAISVLGVVANLVWVVFDLFILSVVVQAARYRGPQREGER